MYKRHTLVKVVHSATMCPPNMSQGLNSDVLVPKVVFAFWTSKLVVLEGAKIACGSTRSITQSSCDRIRRRITSLTGN